MSKAHTAMSREAIAAILMEMRDTGEKYPMELNVTDFHRMVECLYYVWQFGPDSLQEWSHGFLSSIAETLGVEMI